MKRQKVYWLQLKSGIRTALADGTLVLNSPGHMATELIYQACPGDSLTLEKKGYLMAVALFSPERPNVYIYSYAYQKESNWTTYQKNLTPASYTDEKYIFRDDCFFRVCVKRADGKDMSCADMENAGNIVQFHGAVRENRVKRCFLEELRRTEESVRSNKKENSLILYLLADTHYTVNGTWEDTALNIEEMQRRISSDGIIHLGDITDGLLPGNLTAFYAQKVLNDLKRSGAPVYLALGNHDTNYFMGNSDRLSRQEQLDIYKAGLPDREKLYYYIDFKNDVRAFFLTSFDPAQPIRYGFDEEELIWLEKELWKTPPDKKILIFSHDAPFPELDYFSVVIRNGKRMIGILEKYNAAAERQIMAYFHGHSHADFIYNGCSFPIVSIGCAKCEYFTDKKPDGFTVARRKPEDRTQDLWDVMLVDTKGEQIRLVRFGAGEDRTIDCRKTESSWKETDRKRREDRKIRIWAHRGMSGHAPENTMPAFEMAFDAGADGIELDVQLTKDGIPVVIHDETIDRVSDGSGFVCGQTLDELRTYNFAKAFPAYGRVEITTLEQVYQYFRDKEMDINLELKNGVIPYAGLEEKVLLLAEKYGLQNRVLYSSFNHYSMVKLKRIEPAARIAFLFSGGLLDAASYAKRYGAEAVHPGVNSLQDPKLSEECRLHGIRLHIWTVNEERQMETARRLGAEAVITNYPERFI